MKQFKKITIAAALYFFVIFIESCSTSVLVDVWQDPSYHESPLKKIFVIAIRKDPVKRRIWEDAFVIELSKYGVLAESSYHLFPDALPDTNQIIQTVQEKGFDGILITHLLRDQTKTQYNQSYVTREQTSRYNVFRKDYDNYYRDVEHPAYIDSQIVVRHAIDVWVIRKDEQLIWSATSNSPERYTLKTAQDEIADLVIPKLMKSAIIEKISRK
jgi:hypothetical protein